MENTKISAIVLLIKPTKETAVLHDNTILLMNVEIKISQNIFVTCKYSLER